MKIKWSPEGDIKVSLVLKDSEIQFLEEKELLYLKENTNFKSDFVEVYSSVGVGGSNQLIIGLGDEKDLTSNKIREAGYKVAQITKELRSLVPVVELKAFGSLDEDTVIRAFLEGLYQSEYQFDRYKTKKENNDAKNKDREIHVFASVDESVGLERIEEAQTIVEGVFLARDLVNTPSIDLYPETLADRAHEALTAVGVDVEILDKAQIEALGMQAFLAVSKGSERDPRFIIMKYLPLGEDVPALTLVGKGLTYDSGGYAIKPATGMVTMKSDMGGSASVIGAMYAIAKSKLKKNVIALVASCENMISGGAYKNGDVISSMKGSTIEVNNTDAEGRLTLADAIYYAATKVNSEAIIDLATLTGACVVALGEYTTGAVTNAPDIYQGLENASLQEGELLWKLPAFQEMREMIKGDIADLNNSPGRMGGAITAGLFLEHFAEDKPWVHLDIAGPAFATAARSYLPKGGTGVMVKTLYRYISDISQ